MNALIAGINRCSPANMDARKYEGMVANIATVGREALMLARDRGMFIGVRECSTTIRDIRRDAVMFAHINTCSLANRHVRLHANIFDRT